MTTISNKKIICLAVMTALFGLFINGCATAPIKPEIVKQTVKVYKFKFAFASKASWYGREFHGKKTASGETFDMHMMTAAHRTFPFGERLLIKNTANQKTVIVRVNDRGPFVKERGIDVSFAAAKELGIISSGEASVHVYREQKSAAPL
ncbi:MAG: septal ring lytic transglycosylase RlpA family protein [Deltaproteobacteria bacterium]|nr:septal ring lytic transglycosylase RlpA family protein [Deltaproteobacteria bacterium]